MMNIDILRERFDEFLKKHECDMTKAEVLEMAIKIEDELFGRNT